MFSAFISVVARCDKCGLDYSFADSGDGPAVFIALFGGFFVLGVALLTEIAYQPPMWVHMVLFLPLTLVVCLGLLRPFKGASDRAAISQQCGAGGLKN